MVDIDKLCPSCMKDTDGRSVCPHCGFSKEQYTSPLHHLKPGSLLNGKYLVGKAIGEGGFGITYVGYDLNLEIKLAIKEYFPNGFASRDVSNTDTVTIFSGSEQEFFEQGRDKFINEAKSLAKFDNLPGIVSVKDFFLENGTAYIVMEYVEGETLKDFLKRNGGKTEPENIFAMMQPLMKSLAEVHSQGIIHRDISPDNIMITKDSRVKLLDFGAAREVNNGGNKSLSIQLKPGYAPEEQYRSHGNQGPWTDIYALCATMYRAITGVQPIESLERLQNDTLQPPSALGIVIDPVKESALMTGMAVFAQNRFQSIELLYNALYNGQYTQPQNQGYNAVSYGNQPQYGSQQQYGSQPQYGNQTQYGNQPTAPQYPYNTNLAQGGSNKSKLPIILTAVIGGLVIIAAVIVLMLVVNSTREPEPTPTPAPTAAPTAPPTEIPKPVFTKIEASSTRDTDMTSGRPVDYFPSYAIDGDPSTTWSPDRSLGLQPTLTLYADTKQHVTGIKMANGYFKSEETYTRNRRITKVSIEYEGGQVTRNFSIDQFRIMQDIRFDAPADTSYIKIHVLDTYYGDWKDICISEVEVY